MSTSHSKEVVDHEGDLSPSQKPVLFSGFLLLVADLLCELGILDDLIQSRGNLRVQHLEVRKIFSISWPWGFKLTNGSTTSTSLIHTITSDGKSEQVATWFLNRIFQTNNDDGSGNLSNCHPDTCCLCCPTTYFCGISKGYLELEVNGLDARFCSDLTSQTCFYLRISRRTASRFHCTWSDENSRKISSWIKRRKLISKNVFLHTKLIPKIKRQSIAAAEQSTRTRKHPRLT